jgi:hypothetical protein
MHKGRVATANNGANTYPIEALDQENPFQRFLGRAVLVIWYIRYLSASIRAAKN